MAATVLFVGWGTGVRGRETKAHEVTQENLRFFARLQQEGALESLEAVLLSPHGGELQGFVLLRGDPHAIARLQERYDFQLAIARLSTAVEHVDVREGTVAEGLARQLRFWVEARREPA